VWFCCLRAPRSDLSVTSSALVPAVRIVVPLFVLASLGVAIRHLVGENVEVILGVFGGGCLYCCAVTLGGWFALGSDRSRG
jgi:hypothetical protein